MKNLLSLLSLFLLCSCMSGYQKFYVSNNNIFEGADIEYLEQSEEPQLYVTNNLDEDVYDILSKHYAIIGTSNFEGPRNNINLAKDQAKKIGAKIVLVQESYNRTINNIYSNSYGITSDYTDRYNYSVLYFAKLKNDMSSGGFQYDNLTERERTIYNTNTGCIITLVYKDTPAFYANLIRGDIILKIDDKDILNQESILSIMKDKKYNNELNITFLRNGKVCTTKLKRTVN